MWVLWKIRIWKCEFCEKWEFENMNFGKMTLWKCEFCEKWHFENVNFVKNETLKMWISSKLRFSKCDFLHRLRYVPVWANAPTFQLHIDCPWFSNNKVHRKMVQKDLTWCFSTLGSRTTCRNFFMLLPVEVWNGTRK